MLPLLLKIKETKSSNFKVKVFRYLEEKCQSNEIVISTVQLYNEFLFETMKDWIVTGAINLTGDEKKIIDKLNFNQELNLHSRLINDPAFCPHNIFAALEYKTKRVYLRDPMIIYLERELMHSK